MNSLVINSDEFIKWFMSTEQKDKRYKIRCRLIYDLTLLKANEEIADGKFNQVVDENEKYIISNTCYYDLESRAREALKIAIKYLEDTLKDRR